MVSRRKLCWDGEELMFLWSEDRSKLVLRVSTCRPAALCEARCSRLWDGRALPS